MKKIITTVLCFLSLSVSAEDKGYSLAVDVGGSEGNINIYRLGVQKEFTGWLHSHGIPLSGYFEGSLNYWESSNSEIYAIAFSPVFVIPLCDSCNYTPYIEAGTGVSFISEKIISNKDLSSSFQFENRIGVGMKTENIDYHIRYMHYSNASTANPNDGIDIFLAGMAFKF